MVAEALRLRHQGSSSAAAAPVTREAAQDLAPAQAPASQTGLQRALSASDARDIDSMSEAELLALSERIGAVQINAADFAVAQSLDDMPTYQFCAAHHDAAANTPAACQICLEPYSEGVEIRTLTCFHIFHARCIDDWLHKSTACPACQLQVLHVVAK